MTRFRNHRGPVGKFKPGIVRDAPGHPQYGEHGLLFWSFHPSSGDPGMFQVRLRLRGHTTDERAPRFRCREYTSKTAGSLQAGPGRGSAPRRAPPHEGKPAKRAQQQRQGGRDGHGRHGSHVDVVDRGSG